MMQSPIDKSAGRNEGERRKVEAHSLLDAHRESIIVRSRRALLQRLLIGGTATADDVRDVVEVPTGIDPKVFGVVPGALARAGIIRGVGYAKTCRPDAHARPVTVWELLDHSKAEAWLATHPEPPPIVDRSQSTLWPIDRRPAPNEKSDAAGTASLKVESPSLNGEFRDES